MRLLLGKNRFEVLTDDFTCFPSFLVFCTSYEVDFPSDIEIFGSSYRDGLWAWKIGFPDVFTCEEVR